MPEYEVTIDGYESGLTAKTVEQIFREMYGNPNTVITVRESESE